MSEPLTAVAFAKINLALHVRARRPDGYHLIETIFAFAEDGDLITARPAPRTTLAISGPFAQGLSAGEDNLVMRAARAAGHGDWALALEKRLPVAAGIGGGSADAAAVLRMLDCEDADLAARLGADVPACLASVTARAEGLGWPIRPVPAAGLSGMPLLLVNPGQPLATGPVFAGWDGIDRGPLAAGDPLAAAKAGRNDLEPCALALCPVIGDVLALLRSAKGVELARMSGSGATCFALFRDTQAISATAAMIVRDHPDWWCLETRLR